MTWYVNWKDWRWYRHDVIAEWDEDYKYFNHILYFGPFEWFWYSTSRSW